MTSQSNRNSSDLGCHSLWDRHSKWNRPKTLDFIELGPEFSLQIYYSIKKHSLQHKNAESPLEIYNGNAKQTPAKLQPLSNNIFS